MFTEERLAECNEYEVLAILTTLALERQIEIDFFIFSNRITIKSLAAPSLDSMWCMSEFRFPGPLFSQHTTFNS